VRILKRRKSTIAAIIVGVVIFSIIFLQIVSFNPTSTGKQNETPVKQQLEEFENLVPAGRKIAVIGSEMSNGPVVPPAIYIIDLNNGNLTQLPLLPFKSRVLWPSYLSWSPDGKKIAFVAKASPSIAVKMPDGKIYNDTYIFDHIFIVGIEGGKPIQLTDGRSWNVHPTWSPDGKKIAFTSSPCLDLPDTVYIFGETFPKEGAKNIFVMNLDGSNKTQLTFEGGFEPSWSPNSKLIAFTREEIDNRGYKRDFIYILNIETGTQTKLVEGCQPSWSPDGKKIAFTELNPIGKRIGVININGTNLVWLTTPLEVATGEGEVHFLGDEQPAWSPDGNYIAFVSERNKKLDIYIMNADGSNQTRITKDSRNYFNPTWSP
jgi:TolB protein